MPRVLIFASTWTHIHNFHLPYIQFFKEQGYEVHVAANGDEKPCGADFCHAFDIAKSFLSIKNFATVLQLRTILRQNRFDLILTHTALAGAIGRLAILLAGKGKAKVIHTVHGYLFWTGCGFIKKGLYGLPEWLLKGVTDGVITMNDEDTITARKLVKAGGQVCKVPGMGVDPSRFTPCTMHQRAEARKKRLIPDHVSVIAYAAEFSKRKNHMELIRALESVVRINPNVLLLLCGTGKLQARIEREVDRRGLRQKVHFAGWCGRMEEIYKAADLAVSSSISEGLPFNIAEAQLCGLPVVASAIRGHTDLIEHGVTGMLYPSGNPEALAEGLLKVLSDKDFGRALGTEAVVSAGRFDLNHAYNANTAVYRQYMG